MTPHSRLLIAATAVGGAVVLAFGVLLGGPTGLLDGGSPTEPTLVRVSTTTADRPDVEIGADTNHRP